MVFSDLVHIHRHAGLAIEEAGALRGGDPGANALRIERLLADGGGGADAPGLAAVVLNAGAAIYVSGIARSFEDGLGRAERTPADAEMEGLADRAGLQPLFV